MLESTDSEVHSPSTQQDADAKPSHTYVSPSLPDASSSQYSTNYQSLGSVFSPSVAFDGGLGAYQSYSATYLDSPNHQSSYENNPASFQQFQPSTFQPSYLDSHRGPSYLESNPGSYVERSSYLDSHSLQIPQPLSTEGFTGPMRTIPSYAPKKNAVQRKAKRVEEVVPDALWECVLCSVKANMTPLKRRGPDGKRNLCNACYVRMRVRKERAERGTSRPIIPPGGFTAPFRQPSQLTQMKKVVKVEEDRIQPPAPVSLLLTDYNSQALSGTSGSVDESNQSYSSYW